MMPTQSSGPVPSTSNTTPVNPLLQDILQNNYHNGIGNVKDVQKEGTQIKENNDCEIDCNTVVLNSLLTPSVVRYTDTETMEPVSEDTQLLPNKNKEPVEAVVVKQLTSQGADFGLKWFHLVGCVLLLGVVIPLIYVMFYLDKTGHEDPVNST